MKFVFGDIVSFIPEYSEQDGSISVCQIMEYDEKRHIYLVMCISDLYCLGEEGTYYLTEVKERDIESIKNTCLKDNYAYNQVIFSRDIDLSKIEKLNIYELDAAWIDFIANRKLYVDYSDYFEKNNLATRILNCYKKAK